MPGQRFVLNEWILHDLGGDNGAERQASAIEFLERLRTSGDGIAVLRPSSWLTKAFGLMKRLDILAQHASKFLHLGILRDAKICKIVEQRQAAEVPPELAKLVSADDAYLLQTYLAARATLLVTSDEPLYKALVDRRSVQVEMRDKFLMEYLR